MERREEDRPSPERVCPPEGDGPTKEELSRRVSYLEDFREGVFQMLRDLDESERELEEACLKLKETQNQLIQSAKMNALGELAADIAHEINQPLTVIKGLSNNLLRETAPETPRYEKIKLIADSARKMEAVIKHLKVFSRMDAEGLHPVDLDSVIREAFAMVAEGLKNHSIEVKMNLSPLPLVSGSANRLEQVIINLVNNAKDAMDGGGMLEVDTNTVEAGGRKFASIRLRDTGCGISKEIIGRVFDPFFTTKEAGKGTGLGLSISYGMIKEHKGDIVVESAPGKGTTFLITIPAIKD